MAKIDELKFDDKNFNKHTEFGMSLLEKSLRENGAGRSILIDKDNNIIAGNGIIEAAGQIGLENVKIIETNGDEIVAVKRTDIALDSEQGRQMALADNATASVDLDWDEELLKNEFDEDILSTYGIKIKEEFEEATEKPEMPFTEILGEENNYIVLKFNNEIDWLQAQTVFGLQQVRDYGTSDNGKLVQTGLGRVIDGAKAISEILGEKWTN